MRDIIPMIFSCGVIKGYCGLIQGGDRVESKTIKISGSNEGEINSDYGGINWNNTQNTVIYFKTSWPISCLLIHTYDPEGV